MNKPGTVTSGQLNVGDIFDILCRKIAESIVEHDDSRLRKIKSVIGNNFTGNRELNRELALYNEVQYSNFGYESNARAFLEEVVLHCKKLNNMKLTEQFKKLLSESKDVIVGSYTPENPLYNSLASIFEFARKKNPTLEESKNYFKHFDNVLTYLTTNKLDSTPEISQVLESVEPTKINNLVYKCAVERFNERYSELSSTQKEIIQDFLIYRSNERFKKNLLKRLKNISEQLGQMSKSKKNKIENLEDLKKKINEYYSEAKDESVNNLMQNVCDIVDIFEEIKKFSAEQ